MEVICHLASQQIAELFGGTKKSGNGEKKGKNARTHRFDLGFFWQHAQHGTQHILKHITQPGYHFWGWEHSWIISGDQWFIWLDSKEFEFQCVIFGWQEAAENLWGYSYFCLRLSATTPLENKKVFSKNLEHAWKHENKSENHNRENTSSNSQFKKTFSRCLGIFVRLDFLKVGQCSKGLWFDKPTWVYWKSG